MWYKIVELKNLKKKNYVEKDWVNPIEMYGDDSIVGVVNVICGKDPMIEVFVHKDKKGRYYFSEWDYIEGAYWL